MNKNKKNSNKKTRILSYKKRFLLWERLKILFNMTNLIVV